jgi:TATA-box binding protein (TBP) (component of TFIID and TFIIIB)
MKPLPKEFQFKCDEHSLEQCKKLGIINKYNYSFNLKDGYRVVLDNIVIANILEEEIPLISLADYIEEPNPEYIYSDIDKQSERESNLIVELTGKYVIGGYDVPHAIKLAEETVKQLKERGYLK